MFGSSLTCGSEYKIRKIDDLYIIKYLFNDTEQLFCNRQYLYSNTVRVRELRMRIQCTHFQYNKNKINHTTGKLCVCVVESCALLVC